METSRGMPPPQDQMIRLFSAPNGTFPRLLIRLPPAYLPCASTSLGGRFPSKVTTGKLPHLLQAVLKCKVKEVDTHIRKVRGTHQGVAVKACAVLRPEEIQMKMDFVIFSVFYEYP